MARKRMFDLEIINQDSFLDLPMESKAVYFLLGMEADDEGFVAPKKVLRLYGGTEDSLKILIAKKFIIPFSTGVIVITDWKRNNWLDSRRIKNTIYQDEKAQITFNPITEKYEFSDYIPDAKQMLSENSIEENSIEENRLEIHSPASAEQHVSIPYKEICEYLNNKSNSNYRHTTKKTKDLIKARFNEKFTLEDFKVVIDKKCSEWMNTEMQKYLRPETLFGAKFESYLNQRDFKQQTKRKEIIPDWFDKEVKPKTPTPEMQERIDKLLNRIGKAE